MLTTILGTYKNGFIVLDEQPPTVKPVKVFVTFTQEIVSENEMPETKRKAGFAKGTILYMSPDFDDPIDGLFNALK